MVIIAIGFLLLGLFLYKTQKKGEKEGDKTRQDVDYLLVGACFVFAAIFLYIFLTGEKNAVTISPHPTTVSMPSGPTFKLPGGTYVGNV